MAVIFDISLLGDKALQRKLGRLENRLQRKFMRKALRAGAKVIQRQWKSSVPVDTGAYRGGIRVRAARRSRNKVWFNVGLPTRDDMARQHAKKAGRAIKRGDILKSFKHANRARRFAGDEWYYPAILEYGGTRKDGTVVPAHAYGRRAYRASEGRAFKRVRDVLRREVLAEAAKP